MITLAMIRECLRQSTESKHVLTTLSPRAEQAALWLTDLRTPEANADTYARFLQWLNESSAHLLLFMEMYEGERRFNPLDAANEDPIREALRQAVANPLNH